MTITEAQRHDLYETIKGHWGEARAEVMMNLLPPVGWADVATKHDLGLIHTRLDQIDARFAQVDARFDHLEARIDRFDDRLHAMSTRFITWLLTSQATVVAATAALVVLA